MAQHGPLYEIAMTLGGHRKETRSTISAPLVGLSRAARGTNSKTNG